MERLPERYEKEVLEPGGIYFDDDWLDYVKKEEAEFWDDSRNIGEHIGRASDYEIAARGLEAMLVECIFNDYWYIWKGNNKICKDKDFCECVFKAIREVYKEESEGD